MSFIKLKGGKAVVRDLYEANIQWPAFRDLRNAVDSLVHRGYVECSDEETEEDSVVTLTGIAEAVAPVPIPRKVVAKREKAKITAKVLEDALMFAKKGKEVCVVVGDVTRRRALVEQLEDAKPLPGKVIVATEGDAKIDWFNMSVRGLPEYVVLVDPAHMERKFKNVFDYARRYALI